MIDNLKSAVLALAVVLATSTDWALVYPDGQYECAKNQGSCEAAQEAIRRGWLNPRGAGSPICQPRHNCFPDKSNCIGGYNCVR